MTTGPTNLADLAMSVLTSVVEAFDRDGVDLPARRYITTGTVTGVCDAVIVTWESVFSGAAGFAATPQLLDTGKGRVTALVVYIFRCGYPQPVQQGIAGAIDPDPTAYSDYATVVMTDAYVLHRGLQRAFREGTFQDYASRLTLGPAEPVEPEGGMAGVRLTLEPALR